MDDRAALAVGLALLAGVCGAVQPKINAVLGSEVGSPLVAALVNFGVALALVGGTLSLRPATRRRLAGLRSWEVPKWTLSAGLGGALVVLAGAVTVETIGVAIFSVAFFAGQIAFGLLVDRIGVAPGGKRAVSADRLQAASLAVVAVVLTQVGRPAGAFAPAFVAFAVVAGAGVAFQSAFNGRIAAATGDPVAPTAVNVTVGTLALATVTAILWVGGGIGTLAWPAQPWLYVGGALGVTVVFSLAVAAASLGVLRATVTMLAAQIVVAFFVDWAVLGQPPRPGAIAGAVLVTVAVTRVGRRPVPAAAPPAGEM